jgi:hypothetical protein
VEFVLPHLIGHPLAQRPNTISLDWPGRLNHIDYLIIRRWWYCLLFGGIRMAERHAVSDLWPASGDQLSSVSLLNKERDHREKMVEKRGHREDSVRRRLKWGENPSEIMKKRETPRWKRIGLSRTCQSMNYRDREGFSHSLLSIKNYFLMIFDILPLIFWFVDCVWDKIIICKIYETNVSSCCYLNFVELLSKNNYIIHVHIFTTSVHRNIFRNLRKHQIFLSTSDFMSLSADRLLYPDRLSYTRTDFYTHRYMTKGNRRSNTTHNLNNDSEISSPAYLVKRRNIFVSSLYGEVRGKSNNVWTNGTL